MQLKMARAALGLSADELAKAAGVDQGAIDSIERGQSIEPADLRALSLYLSSHGIELIGGDGVRAKGDGSRAFVTVDQLTSGNDGGAG